MKTFTHFIIFLILCACVFSSCGKGSGTETTQASNTTEAQPPKPSHVHSKVILPSVPATCTAPGKTEGAYCSECNEILTAQEELPPIGHIEVTDEGFPATCTEAGISNGIKCSVCSEILTAQEELPPIGHIEVTDEGLPSTCTEAGISNGIKCAVCNEKFSGFDVIPALGHTEVVTEAVYPVNGKGALTEGVYCKVCNETIVEAVDPLRYVNRILYDALGTLENGKAMQELYNRMWEACLKIHFDKTLDAQRINDKFYITFDVNMEDLALNKEERYITYRNFVSENKMLFYWLTTFDNFTVDYKTDRASHFNIRTDNENYLGAVRHEMNLLLYRSVQSIEAEGPSNYEKAMQIWDHIAANMEYAYNGSTPPIGEWSYSSIGYAKYGKGQCSTYSAIYALVMNYNGVPCLNVTGWPMGSSVKHAWNLAQMDDGNWYWFDATGSKPKKYNRFCLTDASYQIGEFDSFLFYLPERSKTHYTPPQSQ